MVPSFQVHLHCCRAVWRQVRVALLRSSLQAQRQANHRRTPAPAYHHGQNVWLSSRNLPLQVESRKLAQRFVGPFEVEWMVNATAVRLILPVFLRAHPTFHVSQVKPAETSKLSPVANNPAPVRIVDGAPAYTVNQILDVC